MLSHFRELQFRSISANYALLFLINFVFFTQNVKQRKMFGVAEKAEIFVVLYHALYVNAIKDLSNELGLADMYYILNIFFS